MKVLVCGGRNFIDGDKMFKILDAIDISIGISCIINGGANGADQLATDWARSKHKKTFICFADWRKYGKAAGPIRNSRMLKIGEPDLVLAFSGGKGTQDMIQKAKSAGVEVREIK